MTRSNNSEQLLFESEIELLARRFRKEVRLQKLQSARNSSSSEEEETSSDESEQSEEETMADRTLRQLQAQEVNNQPLCITYPNLDVSFELKSGLIHLLPKFHGMESESPHKQFHMVCSSMRPQGVTEEQVKLRAFPFSLEDATKDWLLNLPSGTITTWNQMVQSFLDKYFPASRATLIRREISGIKQKDVESLHEYWERFKKLCENCPQHGIVENSLIQYFYEGMLCMERKMVDAASGGCFLDKTPTAAKKLIRVIAATSQQFGKSQEGPKRAYEASSSNIEEKLNRLTTLVQNLAMGKRLR
ncbi:uncharacterized protein [Euphorbia lathyris]|uniref:uncharacterized protein isoform X1 n=1 Tax=Euphorbia lathyris TaxID=212925 RepID=UPI0033143E2C